MKHIDELCDPGLGRAIARDIARLVAKTGRTAARPLRVMEVCGGHTHSIFQFGLKSLLPDALELVHGPGCPVCVLPIGRVDDAIAIAEQPGAVLATFGDALRVPGSKKSLLVAKAEGADVRTIYSPADALSLARKDPAKRVVLLGIGFETTAPSTALAVLEAAREGLPNFSVFSSHVLLPPALFALLDAPDLRVDGFLGPGHVSLVIGTAPYEPVARDYGRPLVVSGFEPVDVLQALRMVVAQIAEGRAAVEIQYTRAVTAAGNPAALAAMREVFEPRPTFAWRGLGTIPGSGLRLRDAYARFDAERLFSLPAREVEDPKACQCGDVLRGARKPWECKVFGTACTPETPLGACMVSSEGACAAYYQHGRIGAARLRDAGGTDARVIAQAGRRVRDDVIVLSHGGGGRAMRDLLAEVIAGELGLAPSALEEDQARLSLGELGARGDRLAFTTDTYVVTPLFFPGGDIGALAVNGTVNDLAVSGALPVALSCGLVLEEGLSMETLRRVLRSMRAAAERAGVAIATGDTKVVERGAADGIFINTSGIGVIPRGVDVRASAMRPGDAVLVSGCLGDHGAAVLVARGDLALETEIASDTAPLHGLVAALLAEVPVHAMRDITRGGLAAVLNELASASSVAVRVGQAAIPVRPEVSGLCRLLGIDPLHLANEGKIALAVADADAPRALAALRAHPLGRDAALVGRCREAPAGVVTLDTGFGGERLLDMLAGEPVPRIC